MFSFQPVIPPCRGGENISHAPGVLSDVGCPSTAATKDYSPASGSLLAEADPIKGPLLSWGIRVRLALRSMNKLRGRDQSMNTALEAVSLTWKRSGLIEHRQ